MLTVKKQILPNKTFLTNFAMQTIILIILFVSNIFSQVVIEERIEINPDKQTSEKMQSNCNWIIEGFSYEDCDSTEGNIVFSPSSIGPGETVLLEAGPFDYEGLLEETLTLEPNCGGLIKNGVGTYSFTSPDTLTVDSLVITLHYDIYYWICAGWSLRDSTNNTTHFDNRVNCPCFPYMVDIFHEYADEQLVIKWDSLFVEVSPSELFPGDTADINIKKRLPDGTLTDFDTTQTFEAAMLEGCTLGNILVDDSIDVYFYDINQPIKFVADTTADSTGLVLLRIGLVEETTMLKSNNDEDVLFDCLPGPPQTTSYAIVQANINEEPTILLGETKYYQARYKTVDELMIEEAPVDANGIPYLDGGLSEDVWGNNPVTVIDTCNDCGKKMGVYWEKAKPMVNGQNLPAGLIRLVGKHWYSDSTYIVKLRAKRNDDSAYINITVKKPDQLGNSTQAIRLNNGIDIESNHYSIDSVCIKWGGQYGFPPQYIKGQYVGESFYDNNLQAVTPGYRYEAWNWEFDVEDEPDLTGGHFWVTWESMGNGNPVPDHINTRYMSYETTPHSVWYFIDRYSNIEHSPSPGGWRVLGNRNLETNRLIFELYGRPTREYNQIRNRIYRSNGLNVEVENPQANEEARLEFIDYMKNDYMEGLENRVAQSRIASSYGPIQPLYITVLNYGFSEAKDSPPENLNDLDIFWPFALDHFQNLLEDEVGQTLNNWSNGLEATLTLVYQGWNPGKSGYGSDVISNGLEFTPIGIEGE